MTTITIPPEIEKPLAEQAQKKGTTPEMLAVDCLRKLFVPVQTENQPIETTTLYDFLSGYVGTVSGSAEALSENCRERFIQGLTEKQQRGHV